MTDPRTETEGETEMQRPVKRMETGLTEKPSEARTTQAALSTFSLPAPLSPVQEALGTEG